MTLLAPGDAAFRAGLQGLLCPGAQAAGADGEEGAQVGGTACGRAGEGGCVWVWAGCAWLCC